MSCVEDFSSLRLRPLAVGAGAWFGASDTCWGCQRKAKEWFAGVGGLGGAAMPAALHPGRQEQCPEAQSSRL